MALEEETTRQGDSAIKNPFRGTYQPVRGVLEAVGWKWARVGHPENKEDRLVELGKATPSAAFDNLLRIDLERDIGERMSRAVSVNLPDRNRVDDVVARGSKVAKEVILNVIDDGLYFVNAQATAAVRCVIEG